MAKILKTVGPNMPAPKIIRTGAYQTKKFITIPTEKGVHSSGDRPSHGKKGLNYDNT